MQIPHGFNEKSFEFKYVPVSFESLLKQEPIREELSKAKMSKLWNTLSIDKRQKLLAKMKLNHTLANFDFDELPDNVRITFTSTDKNELLGILSLVAGVSLLGFYANILDAPVDKPVAQIRDEPRDVPDTVKPTTTDREPDFTHPSSFVGKVTYSPDFQTMEVSLSGKIYGFCRVPERVFDGWEGAGSKGVYFNQTVKGSFDC